MQLQKSILTLLGLVAATHALPTEGLEKRNSVNDCGDSTFVNKSSGGSPLVADCQVITRNIAGGGTWHPGAGGYWVQLVQYGTCAFGVQGESEAAVANVGNQDIIDVSFLISLGSGQIYVDINSLSTIRSRASSGRAKLVPVEK